MIKIFSQNLGDVLVIGIQGSTKEEIEGQYFSLWNHGAVDGELQWWTDFFAVCMIVDKCKENVINKLKKALFNAEIAKIINNKEYLCFKGKKGGFKELAEQRAEIRQGEITEEKFYFNGQTSALEEYRRPQHKYYPKLHSFY